MVRRALPERADVVVIGGGAIGASILFHLAEAGVSDCVLAERGELASGSTSRAAGGVRAQFSDELNIAIAHRSLRAFEEFDRRPGWEIDLRQVGYLFLVTRESDVAAFELAIERQNRLGVPSRMVSAAEARELSPLIDVDDVRCAAFSPTDGHATPEAVVQGYAAGAREHGARVQTHCAVTGIDVQAGRIRRVRTTRGDIATPTVVCACGAWSASVAGSIGVALPVTPLRRQILFTEPMPDLPRELPMTIDFASSLYFHREGPGLLVGMSYPDEQDGFGIDFSDEWLPTLTDAILHRAPRILDVGIKGGWAGLYEMTPDHNALLGEADGPSRFLYATGFSGHGFLQAPAVGEVIRDLVLGREPFVDVSPLGAERFANERLRPERNVV